MRAFGFKHGMLSAAILAALSLIVTGVSVQAAPQAGFTVTSRPASLAFFSQIGSAAPAPQTIQISDNSSNCRVVTVTTGQAWLAVTPNSGCAALHPTVSINAAGLAAGTYAGRVTISSNTRGNSQLRVPVSLTIAPATVVPPLSITTTSLPPGQVGAAYSATLAATGGVPPYSWTATGLATGLAISATGGVSGTPTQAGTLGELFSVADSARTATSKTLSLTIAAATIVRYTLASKPVAAAFFWQIGNAAPASQIIQIVDNSPPGSSCEAVTITTDQAWLAATPNSGCAGLNTTVSVSTVGLAAGTHSGNVVVSSPSETNSPFRVPISFTIAPATVVPPLSITTTSLPPGQVGAAYSATLAATGGVPPYSWIATGLATGLAISATGGVSGTPTQAGTLGELFSVADSARTATSKTLSLTVAAATIVRYTLASKPVAAAFFWQIGNAAPASQIIQIVDNSPPGSSCEAVTITTDQAWLAATPNSGCAGLNTTVSVSTVGFVAGTYSGNVVVSSPSETNSPFRVPVSFTIAPATVVPPLSITTTSLPPGQVGAAYSATLAVTGGVPPYSWAATGLAAGLAISATGGISGTPTQAGTFSELLSVTYANGITSASATLPVTIAAAAPVAYTLASQPASAAFSWRVGSTAPAPQTMRISDNSTTSCETVTVTTDQSWLAVTPNSGCTAFNVTVSINTAALAAGSYVGNVMVSGTAETNSPLRVPVSLVVTSAVPPPSVYLSWAASTSQVAGYNLYRTASSTGNYTKLTSGLVVIMNYTDGSVVSGDTYYYVVTAVDSNNVESVYSNSVSAIIP